MQKKKMETKEEALAGGYSWRPRLDRTGLQTRPPAAREVVVEDPSASRQ